MKNEAYYPEPLEIHAYGNGGFRFGEMSHVGSLLILQSGIYSWDYKTIDELNVAAFEPLLGPDNDAEFLLLGTGTAQHFPSNDIRRAFIDAGVGLEVMDTGAAVRTYNVLLDEGRRIAAALIAAD